MMRPLHRIHRGQRDVCTTRGCQSEPIRFALYRPVQGFAQGKLREDSASLTFAAIKNKKKL